jgi:hypothetical protein
VGFTQSGEFVDAVGISTIRRLALTHGPIPQLTLNLGYLSAQGDFQP